MFPYLIAGAIGYAVAKIFESDDVPKYADGGNVLLAPNGKASNLTPEQYKLVRTPEFKAWFGDWEYLANFDNNNLEIPNIKDYVIGILKDENLPKKIKPNSIILFQSNYKYIICSDENGKIQGALTIYPNGKIDQFAISEKMRGKSIGKKMIDLAIENGATSVATYTKFSKSLIKYFLEKTISKVVDENGEPLVCYHTTDYLGDINIFKFSEEYNFQQYGYGVYFTDDKKHSEDYFEGENYKVYEVFLNLKNPIIRNEKEKGNTKKYFLINREENNKAGAIIYYPDRRKWNYFIAGEPTQIKLADGTNTTFDSNNPDIRFKKGGEVSMESLSKESLKVIDLNYNDSFGFFDFNWNNESKRENFREWLKEFEEKQFSENLDKVIGYVKSDIELIKKRKIAKLKLEAFEELIIPTLGNEVLVPKLSAYEKLVLMNPSATIESIEQGFKEAKNIIDEDGSINQLKITPSNLFEEDYINLPNFERFIQKNPEYTGVFNDWKKLFNEDIELSSKDTYAYRYPSLEQLEKLHSELLSLKNNKKTNMRYAGGGNTDWDVDRYREVERKMFELKKQGKVDSLEYFKLIKERSILEKNKK